jgi:kinesin family protein 20
VPPQSTLNDNNMTMNINETISCASLKKNLCDEEEFRGINHTEPIHIFLKLKPFTQEDLASNQDQKCYIIHSDTTIKINPPQKSIYFKNQLQNRQLSNRIYTFSYVFQPTITQKDFFNATLLPCFQRFISGDNLLIFSYGVTNSGKTFTMQGNRKNPGLIPRTLDCLFDVIKNNLDSKSFKYKPDKFNEIVTLSNSELQKSINYKEQILKLCANFKDFEQTINELGVQTNTASNGGEISLLDQSKFCFSSESLATIGDNYHVNDKDIVSTIYVTSETKYAIWISFYELYDNSIYDLLVPPSKKDEKRAALRIREDSAHVPYVDGNIIINF